MKNKNLLLFIVLSMGLLGIYYAFTPKPVAPPPAPVATVAEAPVQTAVAPAQNTTAPAPALDPNALFSFETPDLKLLWRKQDGSLIQAEWKQDGTRFFPEEKRDDKNRVISPAFIGIGGIQDGVFEGDPEVQSVNGTHEVRFRNALGEQLSYRIPARGHILNVEWLSARGTRLSLIRGLKELPKSQDGTELNPLHDLGRVFTISDKNIQAVTWMDTFKDPWYSFMGGKRKVLPDAAARVGLDAGMEPSAAQRTYFFAAIWEATQTVQLDAGSPGYFLAPDASGKANARLYLGPKHKPELEAFSKPTTQVMDFGFFGLVAKAMFWILVSIQTVVPNWGWAIVVFSVLLRLALWPLNNKTTIQLMRMKDLEPHQKALQAKYEKFGNDMQKKAEMQKELMAFYKKNGHNPMGGCLPMLLQMPVFFALWSMLSAVFELRHANWMLWVHDLSARDPFFVLPVLLGVSMIAQQMMTPATGDPAQRKMMMFLMPAMMTFFFSSTPAGLCLYYLIFNLIGMGQTWWVMRNYKPQPVVI
ncbi:MAG: YidC/Oxa1 family insertase periplasmic-domain containing protein [Holophaga sp.]|nr:YidC/Oxa1 family insertase periplasmic-domain containing protein [Holophaga sp.]